jgi:hypothetical protein
MQVILFLETFMTAVGKFFCRCTQVFTRAFRTCIHVICHACTLYMTGLENTGKYWILAVWGNPNSDLRPTGHDPRICVCLNFAIETGFGVDF